MSATPKSPSQLSRELQELHGKYYELKQSQISYVESLSKEVRIRESVEMTLKDVRSRAKRLIEDTDVQLLNLCTVLGYICKGNVDMTVSTLNNIEAAAKTKGIGKEAVEAVRCAVKEIREWISKNIVRCKEKETQTSPFATLDIDKVQFEVVTKEFLAENDFDHGYEAAFESNVNIENGILVESVADYTSHRGGQNHLHFKISSTHSKKEQPKNEKARAGSHDRLNSLNVEVDILKTSMDLSKIPLLNSYIPEAPEPTHTSQTQEKNKNTSLSQPKLLHPRPTLHSPLPVLQSFDADKENIQNNDNKHLGSNRRLSPDTASKLREKYRKRNIDKENTCTKLSVPNNPIVCISQNIPCSKLHKNDNLQVLEPEKIKNQHLTAEKLAENIIENIDLMDGKLKEEKKKNNEITNSELFAPVKTVFESRPFQRVFMKYFLTQEPEVGNSEEKEAIEDKSLHHYTLKSRSHSNLKQIQSNSKNSCQKQAKNLENLQKSHKSENYSNEWPGIDKIDKIANFEENTPTKNLQEKFESLVDGVGKERKLCERCGRGLEERMVAEKGSVDARGSVVERSRERSFDGDDLRELIPSARYSSGKDQEDNFSQGLQDIYKSINNAFVDNEEYLVESQRATSLKKHEKEPSNKSSYLQDPQQPDLKSQLSTEHPKQHATYHPQDTTLDSLMHENIKLSSLLHTLTQHHLHTLQSTIQFSPLLLLPLSRLSITINLKEQCKETFSSLTSVHLACMKQFFEIRREIVAGEVITEENFVSLEELLKTVQKNTSSMVRAIEEMDLMAGMVANGENRDIMPNPVKPRSIVRRLPSNKETRPH